MRLFTSLLLTACCLGLIGCGGEDGPKTASISGKVTFDGEPLPKGEIILRPADGGTGRSDAGTIENGEFTFESTLGKKRVEIRAMRTVAGAVEQTLETGETGTELEQYIPQQFNDKSTLEAEVTEDGENTFDFPLTSQ
jgi:hypothetical protein